MSLRVSHRVVTVSTTEYYKNVDSHVVCNRGGRGVLWVGGQG